jgi:uncharacterized protein YdhG (YjbR/CyaY superfamily)
MNEYIDDFDGEVKSRLLAMRRVIHEEAPDAIEAISYMMPTFKLNGNLVHFAAMKNHIGFYPTPAGIEPFAQELREYRTSKGAIQFPMDRPLPLELVRKIVRSRVKQNLINKGGK